ncbi:SDR family oxidoreductase [Salibacterium salarium]|uniref:SDR family oxidoreductase n=1 Tax=Salibacterium salarium TaxID=284579 RepID=A0A3R9QME8_9BACI|nr:SDR family oxidoreductase [Salibacterium salarium]RSL33554.1 SDR family oxidoreductase [Salibacterium salarium]
MTHFSDLQNKSVLVTGGSKGIGKDIALGFAKNQANVIISGRNETSLQDTVQELRKHNPSCYYVQADVTNMEDIEKMFRMAVDYAGRLDILVNNAGLNITKPALDVTEEDWDQVLDTNLKSAFFCSQKAAKYMTENNAGKIINIASQMGFVGYWDRAAYCSSKGGMIQLTKTLAIEWAKYNINVNAVAPTYIKTELTSTMFEDEEFEKDVYQRIPLGKLADPSDVTGAVLYLSSTISKFVTGETIKVDGGWTAL